MHSCKCSVALYTGTMMLTFGSISDFLTDIIPELRSSIILRCVVLFLCALI